MKRSAILSLSAAAGVLTAAPGVLPPDFNPEKAVIRKLQECSPRGGLPNFFGKLEKNQPVTVVYFGGSITYQDGFRLQSCQYFQSLFPKAPKITAFNAAIGGTGSFLGALRVGHDVIVRKPDLVIVEFAVNDGGTKPAVIRRNMEGIVRQIRRAKPDCDLLFVYTVTDKNVPELRRGKMARSASVMEDIADYYNIPSIHMAVEIAKLEKEGKLIMQAEQKGMTRVSGKELDLNSKVRENPDGKIPFAPDGTHPYLNTGHILYTDAIRRSTPLIRRASGKMHAYKLPQPMVKDVCENVHSYAVTDPLITASVKGKKRPASMTWFDQFTDIRIFPVDTEITFRFKGSRAILYLMYGPGCGILESCVDKRKAKQHRLFDPYCTYYRLATVAVGEKLDPSKVHTVRLKVTSQTFDKRAILFTHNQADFDRDPGKYKALDLYLGTVFLEGELVR